MSSFINFNNRDASTETKYSAKVIKRALLKSETKSSVKAESLVKNIQEPVALNEALVFFTDKLTAIKSLSQAIIDEGNAFGAARAEAIAKGEKEFTVDGETYPVEDVDQEDKENAEEFVKEKYDKKGLLKALGKNDDGIILVKGQEYIIYNPDNGNSDNTDMWGEETIIALNRDGEEVEFKYSDIERFDEAYDGNMADFKYEFPLRFEEETGISPNAIKKISKKGKGFEVRTSSYMGKESMEKVGDAMNLKLVSYEKSNIVIAVYESNGVNENYEVIFSDGISQMKKFRSEQMALDFMKKEIKANKKLRDIAVYKPGMHSTTQTELVVAFWGDGSYLDNVSKRDPKLADKKLVESTVINEMKKPKSWDSQFAMKAIDAYEAGEFDPEDDKALAEWEKEYNGGKTPNPSFDTYNIIAYALMTGKKPDGTPIKESVEEAKMPEPRKDEYFFSVRNSDAKDIWKMADDEFGNDIDRGRIEVLFQKNKYVIKDFELAKRFYQYLRDRGVKFFDQNFVSESTVNEGRSINKIQKEWNQVTTDMQQKVTAWKEAEGDRKAEILEELKALTARKKALEAELEDAVAGKDKDLELAVSEGNAFLAARAKAIEEEAEEFEFNGKMYPVIKEGNAFGAARAEAIAKGEKEFEVDGEKFPVEDVDQEDKENAKEFVDESVMAEIDILAKNAKDVKDFIKSFKNDEDYKDLVNLGDTKELDAWLKSIYDVANEASVNEASGPSKGDVYVNVSGEDKRLNARRGMVTAKEGDSIKLTKPQGSKTFNAVLTFNSGSWKGDKESVLIDIKELEGWELQESNDEAIDNTWKYLLEKFAVVNEDLRSDLKKYIKDNKKEIDALADQDNWDGIYAMILNDFDIQDEDSKAADEIRTIFNIVY